MAVVNLLKLLSRFVPRRVSDRRSIQILRARLAVATRQKLATVGPGIPIVAEILMDNANWQRDTALLLWTIAQEAIAADDRMAWLICVSLPGHEMLEDLYALAVQAEPIVQLHVMCGQASADEFRQRFVPPASQAEARARAEPDIHHVFSQMPVKPRAFVRATSARSAAHTLVKQLALGQLAIAVDASQIQAVMDSWQRDNSEKPPVLFLVTGNSSRIANVAATISNIVAVRRLGLSFLDELALIRSCDGYVGSCDHSAVVAADAGVPCLLESEVAAEYGDHIRCVSNIGDVSGAWIRSIEQRVAYRRADISIRRTAL